jgi:hypothetical protein
MSEDTTEPKIEDTASEVVRDWPPIPDDELAKGSTITPERLTELGAIKSAPGTQEWAFALLAIRDEIMQRSRNEGRPLSVRIWKNGIHIHTDAEASEYHDRKAGQGVTQIFRQVGNLHRTVDVSALSPAEQQAHDRKLCVWGAKTAAIKRTAKALGHQDY